jgi:two-component system, OmpR family, sensor kinase
MALPIRVRLTLWHVAVLALVIAALGAYLVLRLRTDLVRDVDTSLSARADRIAAEYVAYPKPDEFAEAGAVALAGLAGGQAAAQLLSADGQVLDTSDDPIAARPMLARADLNAAAAGPILLTASVGAPLVRMRVLARPVRSDGQTRILVVGASLQPVDAAGHRLLVILLTGGPIALMLAALAGWLLTGAALRPVGSMTALARRISVDRIAHRVPEPRTNDELGQLATTLNDMLQRLADGVASQRRLVADASHELRSPLAVMQVELEAALADDTIAPAAVDVLTSTAEEVERMSRLVDNLLTLARLDEGELELAIEPLDLRHLAELTATRFAALARAKDLSLEVAGPPAIVSGDAERLRQMLSILVDNAVKYTDEGGVRLEVWCDGTQSGVTVADTGPGIRPADRTDVFGRFRRLDESRANSGSGLGLAIAAEIVRAHGGRIWVAGQPDGGARFTVALDTVDVSG